MKFEFDPKKSKSNVSKHGIDFEQAQSLWKDPRKLSLRARSTGETRCALVASTLGRTWFAVYTVRRGNIRIISVRRARAKEVRIYEEE